MKMVFMVYTIEEDFDIFVVYTIEADNGFRGVHHGRGLWHRGVHHGMWKGILEFRGVNHGS